MTDVRQNYNDLANHAAKIVSAYLMRNLVNAGEVASLIAQVHSALIGLNEPQEAPAHELVPAVPIKKSITPDFIICLAGC